MTSAFRFRPCRCDVMMTASRITPEQYDLRGFRSRKWFTCKAGLRKALVKTYAVIVENRWLSSGRTVQRTVLYLGEINDHPGGVAQDAGCFQ